MSLFQISVVVSLEPGLLALLRSIVDQQSDRVAAAALSADVRAKSDALSKAVTDNTAT